MSGFEETDREWVKDMIRTVGAKYTGCLSRHNNALICISNSGPKYAKAREWRVPAVSVAWLAEAIFGNTNAEQCLHNPKFANFGASRPGGPGPAAPPGAAGPQPDPEPLRCDYGLMAHLMAAWKTPIRVTPVGKSRDK